MALLRKISDRIKCNAKIVGSVSFFLSNFCQSEAVVRRI